MDSIEPHQPNSPTSSPIHPHRASSIYQYHNAPEVLPAHGLEYDDNIYPISDKYPVPHNHSYSSSHQLQNYDGRNNKPPRIIFGMKVRSFLLVGALFCLIVIGAVVGGTVGGRGDSSSNATATSTSTGVQTIAASSTHTSTTIPTATPLSSCPGTNDTIYTYTNPTISVPTISTSSTSGTTSASATSTPKTNTTQTFTLHCDTTIALNTSQILTTAFVYTFEDCVDICGAYNVYGGGSAGTNCSVVVYEAGHVRPQNCWVGFGSGNGVLVGQTGASVGVLDG